MSVSVTELLNKRRLSVVSLLGKCRYVSFKCWLNIRKVLLGYLKSRFCVVWEWSLVLVSIVMFDILQNYAFDSSSSHENKRK